MLTRVRVLELPYRLGVAPSVPGQLPREVPGFALEARTLEEARTAARARLREYGWDLRSLSFSEGNGAELAAVIYARPLRACP